MRPATTHFCSVNLIDSFLVVKNLQKLIPIAIELVQEILLGKLD